MAKLGRAATKRRGRAPKEKAVGQLEKLFAKAQSLVFFDNKGLSMKDVTILRSDLRKQKVAVKMAKNTLIKIALKNSGLDASSVEKYLVGPTMVAVGLEDAVAPAKALVAFLKDKEEPKLSIKAGLLDGKALDAAGVDALSKVPSKEEMIARMLGSLNAPAQNFAYALNAGVSQFAWALSAYQRKLEGEQAAA